jgi:hypothetical protein
VEWEPTSTVIGVCPEDSSTSRGKLDARATGKLTLDLGAFVREALEQESAQLGVPIEELVRFAVLYYLADRDSGRIARRLPAPSTPGEPNPLGKLLGD